jgi:hypothetical protein
MSPHERGEEVAEDRRREIFRALFEADDLSDMTPAQARRLVARRFGVTENRVRQVEREGNERLWPPL